MQRNLGNRDLEVPETKNLETEVHLEPSASASSSYNPNLDDPFQRRLLNGFKWQSLAPSRALITLREPQSHTVLKKKSPKKEAKPEGPRPSCGIATKAEKSAKDQQTNRKQAPNEG